MDEEKMDERKERIEEDFDDLKAYAKEAAVAGATAFALGWAGRHFLKMISRIPEFISEAKDLFKK